jgi:hypothetical protein
MKIIADKKSWTEILMLIWKQLLESEIVFKEASRNFPFIFVF